MKENENKKPVVRVTEGSPTDTADVHTNLTENKAEKLKKPIIYALMAVVFVGCMYMIFKPSADKKEVEHIGLNDAVPQATEAGLPDNKGKAYEQEMFERKDEEKRNALATLSDYWNTEAEDEELLDEYAEEDESYSYAGGRGSSNYENSSMNSYRNMQSTLSSFYQEDNSETMELRKQLEELKEQLAEKDVPPTTTVEDQLALMEKSYEMAARYLPQTANAPMDQPVGTPSAAPVTSQKEPFVSLTNTKKNTVSALYREPTDSAFIAQWSHERNHSFYSSASSQELAQPKNSIKACVHQEQTVIGETGIRLRLLEAAQTPNRTIPKGTIVTALARFQGGRLQLKVSSIEWEGSIIPVDLTIYDLDGQQGLYVPYSPEVNALTEMAGNMSQTSGTSIMMTQSAGQQVAADLSKGVVQGVSGYFAKKVRAPKVTLKAGHQVLLLSKN